MTTKNLSKAMLAVVILSAAPMPVFASAKKQPPKNRVAVVKAREIAKSSFAGEIKSEELEFEGGKWIYSFDLQASQDKQIHEVHVDAISGRVLDSHVESSVDEAKEAADEH